MSGFQNVHSMLHLTPPSCGLFCSIAGCGFRNHTSSLRIVGLWKVTFGVVGVHLYTTAIVDTALWNLYWNARLLSRESSLPSLCLSSSMQRQAQQEPSLRQQIYKRFLRERQEVQQYSKEKVLAAIDTLLTHKSEVMGAGIIATTYLSGDKVLAAKLVALCAGANHIFQEGKKKGKAEANSQQGKAAHEQQSEDEDEQSEDEDEDDSES